MSHPFASLFRIGLSLFCGVWLAACGDFPDLDDAATAEAEARPFPQLMPIIDDSAEDAEAIAAAERDSEILTARAARLKRRAAWLKAQE